MQIIRKTEVKLPQLVQVLVKIIMEDKKLIQKNLTIGDSIGFILPLLELSVVQSLSDLFGSYVNISAKAHLNTELEINSMNKEFKCNKTRETSRNKIQKKEVCRVINTHLLKEHTCPHLSITSNQLKFKTKGRQFSLISNNK